jgi:hypothetical protein
MLQQVGDVALLSRFTKTLSQMDASFPRQMTISGLATVIDISHCHRTSPNGHHSALYSQIVQAYRTQQSREQQKRMLIPTHQTIGRAQQQPAVDSPTH